MSNLKFLVSDTILEFTEGKDPNKHFNDIMEKLMEWHLNTDNGIALECEVVAFHVRDENGKIHEITFKVNSVPADFMSDMEEDQIIGAIEEEGDGFEPETEGVHDHADGGSTITSSLEPKTQDIHIHLDGGSTIESGLNQAARERGADHGY